MRPHVIHLNQSGIARLVAVASAPFHIPIVAHVRLMVDADLIRERARGNKSPRFAIAISQTIAQRLRGADSTVRLVYDPFRPTPPHRTRSEVRAELGIPDDVPVVCMVARLCDGKRHDLLLSAMKRIADERAHCLLVGDDTANAAGDRSYGDGLRLMAKELNLDARVTFAGLRDDVPDLLAASDVSVLPADNEAFGRVLLESLSVNTPIVGSDAGGPREIIGESERGYLFESGNAGSLATAIEAALSNGPESSRRTKAGKEWIAEVCAPSVHARLVSGIYQDAVDSR
jgi:glycosyltransferase involved in cell wall biosynthesis